MNANVEAPNAITIQVPQRDEDALTSHKDYIEKLRRLLMVQKKLSPQLRKKIDDQAKTMIDDLNLIDASELKQIQLQRR